MCRSLPERTAGSVSLVKKQLKELSKQMINNVVGVGVMNLLRKAGPQASLKLPEPEQEKPHLLQPPNA